MFRNSFLKISCITIVISVILNEVKYLYVKDPSLTLRMTM